MQYCHNSRSKNYEAAHGAVLSKFPKYELWSSSRRSIVKIPEVRIMKQLKTQYCQNSGSTNYEVAQDALLSKFPKYELSGGSRCSIVIIPSNPAILGPNIQLAILFLSPA